MVKNTVKSFVRQNKFHTYLTRETLPEEERVSKFHNHGKVPSYQAVADASIGNLSNGSSFRGDGDWSGRGKLGLM